MTSIYVPDHIKNDPEEDEVPKVTFIVEWTDDGAECELKEELDGTNP